MTTVAAKSDDVHQFEEVALHQLVLLLAACRLLGVGHQQADKDVAVVVQVLVPVQDRGEVVFVTFHAVGHEQLVVVLKELLGSLGVQIKGETD